MTIAKKFLYVMIQSMIQKVIIVFNIILIHWDYFNKALKVHLLVAVSRLRQQKRRGETKSKPLTQVAVFYNWTKFDKFLKLLPRLYFNK